MSQPIITLLGFFKAPFSSILLAFLWHSIGHSLNKTSKKPPNLHQKPIQLSRLGQAQSAQNPSINCLQTLLMFGLRRSILLPQTLLMFFSISPNDFSTPKHTFNSNIQSKIAQNMPISSVVKR